MLQIYNSNETRYNKNIIEKIASHDIYMSYNLNIVLLRFIFEFM